MPRPGGGAGGFGRPPLLCGNRAPHMRKSCGPRRQWISSGAEIDRSTDGRSAGGHRPGHRRVTSDPRSSPAVSPPFPDRSPLREHALPGLRRTARRGLRAKTDNALGTTEFGDDRYARAREHFAGSHDEAQAIRYRAGEALAIHNMGRCEHRLENYGRAIRLQRRALTLFAEGHNWRGQAIVLLWLAQSCAAVDDHRSALTHLARSRMLLRRAHLPRIEAEVLNAAAPVLAHLGRRTAAATARRQASRFLREPATGA